MLKRFLLPVFYIAVFLVTIGIVKERGAATQYRDVITWDVEGYYVYLPAIFIYGFEAVPTHTIMDDKGNKYLQPWPGTKKIYTKFTCGEAIFVAPFWLVAHGIASLVPQQFPPDGFSPIYVWSLVLAVAFYLVLGLYTASLILRQYFSEFVTFLGLLTIWLGTAFIQHTSFAIGNSHVFSFLLISLFVLQTPKVLEKPGYTSVFLYGLIYGLICLIRLTNCIIILYFVLYQIRSFADLRARITSLLSNIRYWCMLIPAFIVAFFPQSYYWHYVTGHWFIFSYIGETFMYWKDPYVVSVLWSPRGFFTFAPLMLLSIPGFVMGWKDSRFNIPASVFILAIAIYTFGSWWCWWYGGCYGHRAFIDFFILFLIPLCLVYEKMAASKLWIKIPSLTVICFFLFLSWRLNCLYSFPWEGPNWGWSNVWEKHKQALYIK